MRKLAVTTYLALDGVMQAPGGPEEDPSGGFTLGGWLVSYWDDGMQKRLGESMSRPFDLLLGRKTYEIWAAFWPYADDSFAAPINRATKYVASRTLDRVDWQNSQLLRGDVAAAVRELKREQGPEIQIWGSGNLIQTLLQHDLIDEFRLWFFPLLLGKGKRLFADGVIPAGLKLAESTISSTGVIITRYDRAGSVKTGSVA